MGHYDLPKYFVVIIATQVARFATVYKIVTMAEVVGFELTVPCDTTVFKTAPIDLSGTLPCMEHRTGFEPVVLQFCRLLLWTTQPPMRCLERVVRFELTTFCLASKHSTPELYPHVLLIGGNGKNRTFTVLRMKEAHYRYATFPWYPRVGTIHRPQPYQDCALPLSYSGINHGRS